jgi:hypothetical protein
MLTKNLDLKNTKNPIKFEKPDGIFILFKIVCYQILTLFAGSTYIVSPALIENAS